MKKSKKDKIEPDVKAHLWSALATFISGFAVAILPLLDQITLDIEGSALVAILIVAVRAGVRSIFLSLVPGYK